ncbi:hypothetical protein SteCoe_33697 [Stentor coeruleus]|uniref:Enkurin domain-containing protein n=1 Tax=Stentor coeruleus TaxID=5963 RepID=A0A1R2AW58_9CILI|nr:hypothetical protein SteCoe_33697 [Stentor coeruleus]
MSIKQENDMKSQLSKHINSKIYKRFLEKEAFRKSELPSPNNKFFQYSGKFSPNRGRREAGFSSDDDQPIRNHMSLSRSITNHNYFSRSREISPLAHRQSQENNFLYLDDRRKSNYLQQISPRYSLYHKNFQEGKNDNEYLPVYAHDSMLIKQYDERESKLKDEMIAVKEKYERILAQKNQEIKRLQKINENLKHRADDLEQKLEIFDEHEKRLNKAKDKIFTIENELNIAKERNRRLEKENEDLRNKNSRETAQQIRETEFLRRKIEDLTKEISDKALRFSRSEKNIEKYDQPRNDLLRAYDYVENNRENSDSYDGRRRVIYGKEQRPDPITWQTKDFSNNYLRSPNESYSSLESKLMSLQVDKKRLEDELAKIPQWNRKVVHIRRQQEIELELEILNSSIFTIRNKLQQSNILKNN